jgi:CheY-like chemotaxis protein
MPVMRGRDAVKKMRASGFTNIILGVTGNAKDEEVADFKTSGAGEFASCVWSWNLTHGTTCTT